jgi:hypothetical protein
LSHRPSPAAAGRVCSSCPGSAWPVRPISDKSLACSAVGPKAGYGSTTCSGIVLAAASVCSATGRPGTGLSGIGGREAPSNDGRGGGGGGWATSSVSGASIAAACTNASTTISLARGSTPCGPDELAAELSTTDCLPHSPKVSPVACIVGAVGKALGTGRGAAAAAPRALTIRNWASAATSNGRVGRRKSDLLRPQVGGLFLSLRLARTPSGVIFPCHVSHPFLQCRWHASSFQGT